MSELLQTFSAWTFSKALAHREKVQRVADLLADKDASDITFTAIDSEGNLAQFVLGSIEGNANFLLGRCNPGFYVAPYHYMVVDPSLTDQEALIILKKKGHPAIPEFWMAHNQVPFEEGDLEEGAPHPKAFVVPQKDPTFAVNVNGQVYYANPLTQLVESRTTGHVFAWSLLRNSYLASQAPELAEKMDNFVPGVFDARIEKAWPDSVHEQSRLYRGEPWFSDAYPLVKSLFPKPGSILRADDGFAVVGPSEVVFFDQDGNPKPVEIWGSEEWSLTLHPNGPSHPSAVLNFAKKFLGKTLS